MPWPAQARKPMESLLTAIVDDDRARVKALLRADPGLATSLIDTAKLYESPIAHWIYVGDTALHLAAAGYRLEIVKLLLAAGSDPNSAKNHREGRPLHYAADGYLNNPAWDAIRPGLSPQSDKLSPAPWLWPLFNAASMNATISTVTAISSGACFVWNISTIFLSSSR